MKKIIIGSDKSGFMLKEVVKKYLVQLGYDVTDCGTQSEKNGIPFFEVAPVLAKKVQAGEFEKGVLICGTGMGMAMVANKFQGVYAAVCESTYAAEKCRAINDANVLTMGGWLIAENLGCEMVDKFLNTAFTENLEDWRQVNLRKAKVQVQNMEKEIYKS